MNFKISVSITFEVISAVAVLDVANLDEELGDGIPSIEKRWCFTACRLQGKDEACDDDDDDDVACGETQSLEPLQNS